MTYVITQNCCNDASCIEVCPVDCIRPTPDDPGFSVAEMLYIDPATCIDCGACMDDCPVDAISLAEDLLGDDRSYVDVNRRYFEHNPLQSKGIQRVPPAPARLPSGRERLRIAIVGTGPGACYAIEELLHNYIGDVEIDVFEKTSFVGGLVRYGVAPDHERTKAISERFERALANRRVQLFLNVEVGVDIAHDDLTRSHHAVLYASGAARDRRLEIPGVTLPGSFSATEFVGWYNGDPGCTDLNVDLRSRRAVVVGNGNVALDMARILIAGHEYCSRTDIATHALTTIAGSEIEEVFVVGRRGPAEAAFTGPELRGLAKLPGVRIDVDLGECELPEQDSASGDFEVQEKLQLLRQYQREPATAGEKRIVLCFGRSPVGVIGKSAVEGVEFAHNTMERDSDGRVTAVATGATERVNAGLVVRATGFRGTPVADVPFSEANGVIPNVDGRVVDDGTEAVVPGVYVCGWIKRGPQGVIGTNRHCAAETVAALIEDWTAGALAEPEAGVEWLAELVERNCPGRLDYAAWRTLDKAEREAGRKEGRPRVKLIRGEDVIAALGSSPVEQPRREMSDARVDVPAASA